MSESVLIVIISFIFSIVTAIVASIINRKATFAKAGADSSEAAESLSESARNIIQTYEASVVNPLRDRIADLAQQMSVIEQDRFEERLKFQSNLDSLQTQIDKLKKDLQKSQHQSDYLIGELRRADDSLEYLTGMVKDTNPVAVERALKIRRGQL